MNKALSDWLTKRMAQIDERMSVPNEQVLGREED
jgi:hypothetical protein